VPVRRDRTLAKLGSRIRSLRRQRQLSQEELAALAHIDRAYMSDIERGQHNIGVLHAARIARALKVPLATLFE
jgi:transcriptional regulator with XRE-family HTH domain